MMYKIAEFDTTPMGYLIPAFYAFKIINNICFWQRLDIIYRNAQHLARLLFYLQAPARYINFSFAANIFIVAYIFGGHCLRVSFNQVIITEYPAEGKLGFI